MTLTSFWQNTGYRGNMQLTPDVPIGVPAFDLSSDEIETVVGLVCDGARAARAEVKSGHLEVPITIIVRKEIRRLKKGLGLTNVELRGEHELENMAESDASLLGRIDITLKFLRQFGDADNYVAIECKRVGAGVTYNPLNSLYVTKGVIRFVNGQYAAYHAWGFMLGYVLALPVEQIVGVIDAKLRQDYEEGAKLVEVPVHPNALAICDCKLVQASGAPIRLRHIFVDMTSAV
jgi:hypothetical protein